MNVYSEVNIIQTFPLPLGFGLNMDSCFGGRSFPCGSPFYACSLCHRLGGQGDRKWDNTWVAVVTVVCGFQQRGVTISGKRHPVLPKKPLGSSTFLDISIIFYQFILLIEWLPINIKLLNRTIHGPMYKWSQRCVCWWLGMWIWCQGICSHHIYAVTFSSFHILI